MLNNLFLLAGEKTTVIGGKYNGIGKCYFGCTIRVVTMWGREIEKFSEVRQGFKFGNPTDESCRLEIENGEFDQDIQIYSGNMDVTLPEYPYDNICRIRSYKSAVSAEYNLNGIRNLSKRTAIVSLTSKDSTGSYNFGYRNLDSFCTETPKDLYNINNISLADKFNLFSGSVTSISTAITNILLYDKMNETGISHLNQKIIFPPNKMVVFCQNTVNVSNASNILIEYKG